MLSAPRRRAIVIGLLLLAGAGVAPPSLSSMPGLVTRTLGQTIELMRAVAPSYVERAETFFVPAVTATKTASLAPSGFDVDADGKADAGDKIRYTVTISDATDPATNVHFADTPDPNTTLVGGSIVISPLAIDETYTSVGNMTLTSSAINATCAGNPLRSVTCNDTLNGGTVTGFGPLQGSAAATAAGGTGTSANGGSVVLNSDGTFVYNPPAGFEGADSFWYTLTSPGGVAGTDVAQVTINVSGMVWFVSSGGGGAGRQNSPLTLAAFNTVNTGAGTNPADGDTVFLLEGAHTGPVTLRNGQRFIGQDNTAAMTAVGAPAAQPGNAYLANAGGTVSITSASTAITLASGNTLAGFSVGNSTTAIVGGTAGTVSVREVAVNTSGRGLAITTSATFADDATFTGFTAMVAAGGTNGVSLTGAGGTLKLGTGALSGASGAEFFVSGGNATVTFGGTITQNNAQRVVDIQNTTGGSITLSGTITGGASSTGVNISGANGGVAFTTLNLGTSGSRIANQAVTITGGSGSYSLGTVGIFTSNVAGIVATSADGSLNSTAGTVDTGQATAINIDGPSGLTTLGMTLTRVDSSGGSATGIIIQDTDGGFAVNGDGSNTALGGNATGGTIASKTGSDGSSSQGIGVYLNNAQNIRLRRMVINGTNQNFAIRGHLVTNLKLEYATVGGTNGTNNANVDPLVSGISNGEDAIRLTNLSGTNSITSCNLSGGFTDTLHVENTTGTLTRLTITTSTITGRNAVGANDAVNFLTSSGAVGAVMNLTVTNSTLTTGITKVIGTHLTAGNTMDLVFRNNTVTNLATIGNLVPGTGGVGFNAYGNLSFDISNNTFDYTNGGNGIKMIGVNIFKGGGSTGNLTGTVINNNIGVSGVAKSGAGPAASGLNIDSQGTGIATVLVQNNRVYHYDEAGIRLNDVSGSSTFNPVVVGNTTSQGDSNAFAGFYINAGAAAASQITNLQLGGGVGFKNDFSAGDPFDGSDVFLQQDAGTFNLSQGNSASGTVSTVFNANNTPPTTTFATSGTISVISAQTVRLMVSPSNALEDGSTNPTYTFLRWGNIQSALTVNFSVGGGANFGTDYTQSGAATFGASSGTVTFAAGSPVATVTIDPVADTTTESDETVVLTVAAGVGYTAASPSAATATILNDDPASLFTVVQPPANAPANVTAASQMSITRPANLITVASPARRLLTLGANLSRAIVARLEAQGAPPVDVDVAALLPVGKAVRVVFDVIVNTPVVQYSNQGAVSGSNFSSVLTTIATTTGDRYDTGTALVSSSNPSSFGESITFTATVTPTQGSITPNGTVQFKDGVSDLGAAVSCASAPSNTCTAQLTTSSLSAASHNITAVYGPGTNHDASTSNTVVQVVNACTATPITVTSTGDSGAGTLRQAISDACSGNTISFGGGVSPISLTGGQLTIDKDLTITGAGANVLTVQRTSGTSRIFAINAGKTVTISGLTLTGGAIAGSGGAIFNDLGTLTLSNVALVNNSATSSGGAILNSAGASTASLTILNSTLSGNTVTAGNGGAILSTANAGGTATLAITNATISGNSATGSGGGVFTNGNGTVSITNATITNNRADSDTNASGLGGGLTNAFSTVSLRNTIIAGNLAGTPGAADDVNGTVTGSNNLIGVDTNLLGITHGAAGNQIGTAGTPIDPKVGALASNGGTTQTHALLLGSPALDAGDNSFVAAPPFINDSPIADQRGSGAPRIRDAADANSTQTVDIGALEADPAVEDIADKSTNEDTLLAFTFNVGDGTTTFDSISATSSNTALVPNANAVVTADTASTRTLTLTPLAGQSGTTTITVTVTKTIAGTSAGMSDTFVLTVNNVNDTPTISNIANQTPAYGTAPSIPFTLGDEDTALISLTVSATSSNTTLVPNANLSFSGSGGSRSITVTPAAGQTGTTTITVTVNDGNSTANDTFDVTITAPTISVADATILEGTGGTVTVNLDVTLSASSPGTVTVQYATSQATAIAGVDFTTATGTLSFLSGTTTLPVTLTVTSDAATEINEWATVTLSSPTNAVLSDSSGLLTITDDDGTPEQRAVLAVWSSATGVTAPQGTLTKTATLGWNAAAASSQALLNGDGSMEFTATALATRMAGLSRGNTDTDYADVDFGLYLHDSGQVYVLESGTSRGVVGTYAAGDRFAVAVEGGGVVYRKNGVLLYTSAVVPAYPLQVDTALYTPAATLTNVVLSGRMASPVIWTNKIGVTATGGSLTKTAATGWNAGAASTRGLLWGDGSVAMTALETTTTRMFGLNADNASVDWSDLDFGLYLSSNGTVYVVENGVTQGVFGSYHTGDHFQVAIESGVVVYRQNGLLLYTSAVAPTFPLHADAALYTTGATLSDVALTGDFAREATFTGGAGVTISASTLTNNGTAGSGWTAGAVSTRALVRDDGFVEFTTLESTTAKLAGLSHGNTDHGYADIDFGVLLAANATVYVFEGGAIRGVFGGYEAGDRFRVAVESGVVKYRKNGVLLYTSAVAPVSPLLVDTSLYTTGATIADVVQYGELGEAVTWTATTNVTAVGNALTKTGAPAWNAGAISTREIASGDGYVTFTTSEANTHKLVGLSVGNTNADYGDVDFGILLAANGTFYVFEGGVSRGVFSTYVAGDHFAVAVEAGAVKYQKNGVTFYTSGVAPAYPLLVDTAFYTVGGTITDVVLGCVTTGCQ